MDITIYLPLGLPKYIYKKFMGCCYFFNRTNSTRIDNVKMDNVKMDNVKMDNVKMDNAQIDNLNNV